MNLPFLFMATNLFLKEYGIIGESLLEDVACHCCARYSRLFGLLS